MSSDLTLGWAAISWIEAFLRHGPGDVQGKRISLDDEFAAFILKAYAVDARGARRVRRAFLSRAKGRAKSELAAMIACFEALGECRFDHWAQRGEVSDWGYAYEGGEPVGRRLPYVEIICVATEEGQAGNTYDNIYRMLHPDTASPELLDRFGRIDVGLTRINLPDYGGVIEPATAANESKDGAKSTYIVADESHLWVPPGTGVNKLAKMHQTMVRNLLKRKESSGWMLETSTMYAEGEDSVAEGTHAYAKLLAESGRRDKLLFDHRQAGEHWDLSKRSERLKALREAYGPASAWMDLKAIADYWDDPQASHAEFRRFFLNQPVAVAVNAFDIARWAELAVVEEELTRALLVVDVPVDRRFATIGVAGSAADGRTLVMCMRESGTGWVADAVTELVAVRDIVEVALTPGAARGVAADLAQAGIEFVKMSGVEVAASCSAFQEAVKAGTVCHVAHVSQQPLDAAVGTAKTRRMGDGETWDRGNEKIDISPLIACAAACYRYATTDSPMPAVY